MRRTSSAVSSTSSTWLATVQPWPNGSDDEAVTVAVELILRWGA